MVSSIGPGGGRWLSERHSPESFRVRAADVIVQPVKDCRPAQLTRPWCLFKAPGGCYQCRGAMVEYLFESRGGTLLCRKRSARRESVGVKLHLCWESPEYPWRWRVAERPRQRSEGWRICHHTIRRHVVSLRSVRKKSPTSACRRSLSSTRKTPQQPSSAKRLPEAVAEAAEAAGAAEVAREAAEAAEVVAAAAASHGGPAESARLELFDYLARRRRHGRVSNPAIGALFAAPRAWMPRVARANFGRAGHLPDRTSRLREGILPAAAKATAATGRARPLRWRTSSARSCMTTGSPTMAGVLHALCNAHHLRRTSSPDRHREGRLGAPHATPAAPRLSPGEPGVPARCCPQHAAAPPGRAIGALLRRHPFRGRARFGRWQQ
jgi:hypothetical protein